MITTNMSKIKTEKIIEWKNRNGLKKAEFDCLLEAWRRVHMFKDGNFRAKMTLLCFPYQAKQAMKAGFFEPLDRVTPRVLNWYNLTPKGIEVLKDLPVEFDDELNLQVIFLGDIW